MSDTSLCLFGMKAINWTQNAWHLVVVATDAPFHTAGEGKVKQIYLILVLLMSVLANIIFCTVGWHFCSQ